MGREGQDVVVHTLRLDRSSLNGEGVKTAQRTVRRITRGTFNRSQVLCPVDTGNLRATGQMDMQTSGLVVSGSVEYTARYAAAVHEGRRALTIRAKGGGRLKFVIDGRTVYAREVHQPARAGRPFLRDALIETAAREGITVSIG
jgi:hypothetical protein